MGVLAMGCNNNEPPPVVALDYAPTTAPQPIRIHPSAPGVGYFGTTGDSYFTAAKANVPYKGAGGDVLRESDQQNVGHNELEWLDDTPSYYKPDFPFQVGYWPNSYGSYRSFFAFGNLEGTNQINTQFYFCDGLNPSPNPSDPCYFGNQANLEYPPCDIDPDQPHCSPIPPQPSGPTPKARTYFAPQPWHAPFYAIVDPDGDISRSDMRRAGQNLSPAALDQISVFLSGVYGEEIELFGGGSEFLVGLDIVEGEDLPEGEPGDITNQQLIDDMRDYYNDESSLRAFGKDELEVAASKVAGGGKDAESNAATFGVYPNPTVSDVTVRVPAGSGETVTLTVYTVDGRQVYVDQMQASAAGDVMTLQWPLADASGSRVAAGVYVIRATSGNEQYSAQVVVM